MSQQVFLREKGFSMRDATGPRTYALWRLSLLLPLLLLAACGIGTTSAKAPAPIAIATAQPITPAPTPAPPAPPITAGVYFITQKQAPNQTLVALNPGNGSRRWSINTHGVSQIVPTDRVIYLQGRHGIEAVRASDGAQLWSRSGSQGFAYANDVVYCFLGDASSTAGVLAALDRFTGVPLWTTTQPIPIGTILPANGVVVVVNNSMTTRHVPTASNLYVVDARTGRLIWNVSLLDRGMEPVVTHGDILYLPLLTVDAANSIAYVQLHAYRLTDGAPLWQTGNIQDFDHLIDADNARVYVGTNESIVALKAANGALAWTDGNTLAPAQALLANGILYTVHADAILQNHVLHAAAVVAVDASTGTELWLNWLGASFLTGQPPLLVNGMVYVPTEGGDALPFIWAYNAASGRFQWYYQIQVGHLSARNGTIYAGDYSTSRAEIYALNASSGATLWKYTTDSELWSGVQVAG